jgi:hypothetical protein
LDGSDVRPADVRFGSKADMCAAKPNVPYGPIEEIARLIRLHRLPAQAPKVGQ